MSIAYLGMRAPATYRHTVTSKVVDLTTVTAAALKVKGPDGVEVTWTAAIEAGATTGKLVAIHDFAADGSDLAKKGLHIIYAELTVPGGVLTSKPVAMTVKAKFDPT